MLARPGRQDVRDVAPGVGAAGVHDTVARVAALTAEAVVEPDAETAQLRDPGGSLVRQQPHGARPAEVASRGERVCRVELRIVVRADGCGHASLSRVAVRAAVRGLGEDVHGRPGIGGGKGG